MNDTPPYGYYDFGSEANNSYNSGSDRYGYIDDDDDDDTGAAAAVTPHQVLKKYWGYDDFRSNQLEIINSVLSGHDTIGLLPTGGGKSITFQVPAMINDGLTLVITPLISLMKDQVDALRRVGIRAAYLHHGMTRAQVQYVLDRADSGKLKLLYVAPERLESQAFMVQLRRWRTSLVVVDEAHCISQWGYDFRPCYLRLATLRQWLPGVSILALTASATPEVVADISRLLELTNPNIFSADFRRDNISFLVRNTVDKAGKLLDVLSKTEGATIVYVRSRRRTVEIARALEDAGIKATYYHAGLASEVKTEHQNLFNDNHCRVMVATTAFGMGIDKPDVRYVVHYDIPTTIEEYYQEAGRAGRDGKESVAVMLVSPHDKATLSRRLTQAFPEKDFVRHVYDEICRYLCIAMGEGFNTIMDFDPEMMCRKYELPLPAVMSAIAILQRAEYLQFIEDTTAGPQVMFTVTRHDLYDIEFSDLEEEVLEALLRTYTGLFTDLQFINEELIAFKCRTTRRQVYEILKSWRRRHIIQYIPKRDMPVMFFTANRVPGEKLIIPPGVYEERRAAMEHKVEAMKTVAFGSGCRVAAMLRYFGQVCVDDCGKCDVCRCRRAAAVPFDAEAFKRRLPEFFAMITPARWLQVRSLEPYYPSHFSEVLETLRSLAAEGIVEFRDGAIKSKKSNKK